jgi:hypothetical protein
MSPEPNDHDGDFASWAHYMARRLGIDVMPGPSWMPVPYYPPSGPSTAVHIDGWLDAPGVYVRVAATDLGNRADAVSLHIECGRELAAVLMEIALEQARTSVGQNGH